MKDYDLEEEGESGTVLKIVQIVAPIVVALVCAVLLFVLLFSKKNESDGVSLPGIVAEEKGTESGSEGIKNGTGDSGSGEADSAGQENQVETGQGITGDPQDMLAGSMGEESGTSVGITEILSASSLEEKAAIAYGIDVARYQGTIDWSQAAQSGVEFAMVRVGYRTLDSGEIVPDSNAKYNMQEAAKNGIQVGAYFFSTAISGDEAREEADWVADYVSQYQITYPVAYNCEGFDRPDSRQYALSVQERSDLAAAFLERVYERGYTPMFYAAKNELQGSAKWDTEALEARYKIWVAQYPAAVTGSRPDYDRECAMWQYTNQGIVPGIPQPVDMNIAYFGYEGMEEAKNSETPEDASADPEALMRFNAVEETVTAKDATNLRDIPGQGADSHIIYTLRNGETATRTGVSDSGWSRVLYNGQTLYAVSNYLTTDLTVPAPAPDDGIKTVFQDCNDTVTAKIEVNLRSLPSVTNPESQVAAVLHNGEYIARTGVNTDYGWSRVDYNGQTLYCISSYLSVEGQ